MGYYLFAPKTNNLWIFFQYKSYFTNKIGKLFSISILILHSIGIKKQIKSLGMLRK